MIPIGQIQYSFTVKLVSFHLPLTFTDESYLLHRTHVKLIRHVTLCSPAELETTFIDHKPHYPQCMCGFYDHRPGDGFPPLNCSVFRAPISWEIIQKQPVREKLRQWQQSSESYCGKLSNIIQLFELSYKKKKDKCFPNLLWVKYLTAEWGTMMLSSDI